MWRYCQHKKSNFQLSAFQIRTFHDVGHQALHAARQVVIDKLVHCGTDQVRWEEDLLSGRDRLSAGKWDTQVGNKGIDDFVFECFIFENTNGALTNMASILLSFSGEK